MSSNECEDGEDLDRRTVTTSLSALIREHKDLYYLQPVELGKVFECVVKRDKS